MSTLPRSSSMLNPGERASFPLNRTVRGVLCAAALIWVGALWWGPDLMRLLAQSGWSFDVHGLVRDAENNHPFADARTLWGVPNALDVLSNVPFVLAGLWGAWCLRAWRTAGSAALRVLSAGLLCTGFGSAWYHLAPDAAGLLVDRLGISLALAGTLGLAWAERVDSASAASFTAAVMALAITSAAWVFFFDNPVPWVVVQFAGVGTLALCAWRTPLPGAAPVPWVPVIAAYALAKVLEGHDTAVFLVTGGWVSGHTLKHLAAAAAVLPILVAITRASARQNQTAL